MTPPRRTTLKDVAKIAQLSLAAVSMAMRNHPSLPAKTFERVKRIAAKLGYVSLNVADDAMEGAAGIRQPRTTMGALAINALSSLMQRNQRGFQAGSTGTLVDGEWQEGRTLRRRSGRQGAAG